MKFLSGLFRSRDAPGNSTTDCLTIIFSSLTVWCFLTANIIFLICSYEFK